MIWVRGSEVQDFLRCRHRWSLRWVEGLVSKRPNNKLLAGNLIHKFLETYYTSGLYSTAYNAMMDLYQETNTDLMDQLELDEMMTMIDKVVENYTNHYRDYERFEVIATELQFRIPLDEQIGYEGTIDLVLRERSTGEIWFMDHKTTDSIAKYEKNAIMDRQISRYWWALQQLTAGKGTIYDAILDEWVTPSRNVWGDATGIAGFLYNIILKDYPVPPTVLKSGKLSQAKNQNTAYNLYIQALADIGHEFPYEKPPAEYEEFLDYLRDNPREYFKRVEVLRNQAEIDASIKEFYMTALDLNMERRLLRENRDGDAARIYRNITSDCSWDCPFRDVCIAGFDGSNVDYLLDALYDREVSK